MLATQELTISNVEDKDMDFSFLDIFKMDWSKTITKFNDIWYHVHEVLFGGLARDCFNP